MRIASIAALVVLGSLTASAQYVTSAKSGILHYSEGAVNIDGKAVDQKLGVFPDIKEKSELSTEAGRAEVLLTPGVFLRVGENTSVRMITNRLIDTRVEFVSGEAIVESDDPMKDNNVTVVYKDFQVHVRKSSVLCFQSNPEQLKVYHGEAEVELNGNTTVVKAGKLMPFSAALATERFDVKNGDELARWSQRRSEYVAMANVSAAQQAKNNGSYWGSSSWYYNPYYSMYTYMPYGGVLWNPYGYGFFSPYTVYQAYYYVGNGGGGGVSGPRSGANAGFGRQGSTGSAVSLNSTANNSNASFGRNSGYSAGGGGFSTGGGGFSSGGGGFSSGGSIGGGGAGGGHGGGGHR